MSAVKRFDVRFLSADGYTSIRSLGITEPGIDTPDGDTDPMPVVSEVSTCNACEAALEHCHGVAIVHVDGSHECSDDPDCRLGIEAHLFSTWEQDWTEEAR